MLVCDLCLLNLVILVVSGLSGVLGALGRILLSYLVHMHSRLRSVSQGQVHVGPITWEVLPQKLSHFDGEDYSFWSHKTRSHLFSLHPSIWEIVENGMQFDSSDNPVFINEQIHKNAQATTILLASLCRMNTTKSVAWTMPSKYGIPSKSLTRVMTPP
jgi:hypothetical protein